MRRSSVVCSLSAVLIGLLWLSGSGQHPSPLRAEEEQPSDAALKQRREARLRAMHTQVETVTVKLQSGNEWRSADLHAEPLFRYADVPRGIIEASLWCWGGKGRPATLTKLEMVAPHENISAQWQYCIASLSEQPVLVTWPSRPQFLASKAGVALNPIPDAPEPDDKPAARMRQMKELAKRFSATIVVDGKADLKQEMRQLASPIHRYSDPDSGLTDGAIFGFSTNGTNPDVLLLVEATSAAKTQAHWTYAVVGMTYAEFHVRLGQTEIFYMPYPPRMDTWAVRIVPRLD